MSSSSAHTRQSNEAAWLVAKCATPLEVNKAPYPSPHSGEIVVRTAAIAINPVDCAKQVLGNWLQSYIKYPFILGADVAGEVVQVGKDVDGIKVGDRVLGLALGGSPDVNNAAEGAYQHYVVLRQHFVCPIPDSISFEQACVLPLAACTAAYGLFSEDYLALRRPTVVPTLRSSQQGHDDSRSALIITGGASSVGCNAIQLARAAGYRVYSTASPKNFDYVLRLGATNVFDYHRKDLVDTMLAALNKDGGVPLVGAFAIGNGSVETCIEVLSRYIGREGGRKNRKFVAFAGFPSPPRLPATSFGTVVFMGSILRWMVSNAVRSRVKGVETKFINVKNLSDPNNVVSKSVFAEFLPKALAVGEMVPAPVPLVVGKGLDKIQDAFEVQQRGVSAKKVVVSI